VDQPDEYFGGQKTLEVFEQAMATAHPFPYVKQWTDIDGFISTSLQDILLNHAQVQTAVDAAVEQTNNILSK
jgi:maltose-binding protein MalE